MNIHCVGQGSLVISMDAGLNDFSVSWALLHEEIASFAQVCTYDRAGLGWSEPSTNPRTSENIVSELHRLVDQAELEAPYVLVGHPFGGMDVRLYAHRHPD